MSLDQSDQSAASVGQTLDEAETTQPTGLSFVFADSDTFCNELNELYSYVELSSLRKTEISTLFTEDLNKCTGGIKRWTELTTEEHIEFIESTLSYLDLSPNGSVEHYQRFLNKASIILYVAQGSDDSHPEKTMTYNCQLLLKSNCLPLLLQVLLMASNISNATIPPPTETTDQLQQQVHHHIRQQEAKARTPNVNSKKADHLMCTILNIIYHIVMVNQGDPLLQGGQGQDVIETMIRLVTEFSDIEGNRYPVKKIILVLWKTMTAHFGSFSQLEQLKENRLNSCHFDKDTPKTSPYDVYNFIKGTSRFHHQVRHSSLHQVTSHLAHTNSASSISPNPIPALSNRKFDILRLPSALGDSLRVLEKNMYPPRQLYKDIGVSTPSNRDATNTEPTPRIFLDTCSPFEQFYSSNLSTLSKTFIVLLKILLAAVPGVKSYTGPINLKSEITIDSPSPGHSASLVETMQSAVDFLRHKEIISKALLAILLLLLKHAKYNQVLQFENLTQIIFDSNGLVLAYKYLVQESIEKFIKAQNIIPKEEFYPVDQETSTSTECWRNLFSTACLLRIIQKVSKYHPSRFTVIPPSKAVNILKKYSVIEQPTIRKYSLKIIKSLLPYLTKKWRQNNMKVITDIFLHVPIHINDVWLSQQNELTPQEASEMEQAITDRIEEYHQRNYEQWYDSNTPRLLGELMYSRQDPLGMNEIDFTLNSLELTESEKQQSIQLADVLCDTSSSTLMIVLDKLEDQLLYEQWNIQKPSFSIQDNARSKHSHGHDE
ncbi:hypothetical protein SAMD00019534_090810 [Acytostelium subglobosum LB1]|uniref:hypothetical protein n=1 Tax=Acytostelium subglobosum LB1 TaxID=1410327 RepID=UPI000644D009|nr:hypothetical protein SAMD00019534_090810 [Acytostelium subglobosum LB1]GAM25906.1 hypothetical protein SAMD00019534_090810 [Acytostelium subglobosum LB1]|eukprot:XP_012750949.1 hypothetical protein SAMD00019534_090810 [Acytostelium subglobosum LB1]